MTQGHSAALGTLSKRELLKRVVRTAIGRVASGMTHSYNHSDKSITYLLNLRNPLPSELKKEIRWISEGPSLTRAS